MRPLVWDGVGLVGGLLVVAGLWLVAPGLALAFVGGVLILVAYRGVGR